MLTSAITAHSTLSVRPSSTCLSSEARKSLKQRKVHILQCLFFLYKFWSHCVSIDIILNPGEIHLLINIQQQSYLKVNGLVSCTVQYRCTFIVCFVAGHKWAESLNLQRIVTSRLNPLRICLPVIVKTFSSITRYFKTLAVTLLIESALHKPLTKYAEFDRVRNLARWLVSYKFA